MPDNPRWRRRHIGSTWGDWGPDDQLGRLNLLTPDKVLKGVAEVKAGRTFCLSMQLDYPRAPVGKRRLPPAVGFRTPSPAARVLTPRRPQPRMFANKPLGMPYAAYPLSREDPRL